MSQHYLFGLHAVSARLRNAPESIQLLYLQQGREDKRMQAVLELAQQQGIRIQQTTNHELEQRCQSEQHQGVVAACEKLAALTEADLWELLPTLASPPLLLILDGITDPHNLGAILRSADAAGVHAVIAPKDKAVAINATVSKVACGAAESVAFIQVTNLARTMKQLQQEGVWIYGTDDQATQSLYDTDLTGACALVMGAEGKGMRRLTREHCDYLLNLPMAGSVSSLNVSVATGVCLFEVVRQRR